MRAFILAFLLAAIVKPSICVSQSAARERGVYLTVFRSPATGIELRAGHAATYVGFYPTVISRDGKRANANFIRAGFSYYVKEDGPSPYLSPSMLVSLGSDWKSGMLNEIGYRGRLYGRVNGRVGAAVLTTFDGQVRVNPTIGLDLKLGASR